MSAAEHVEEGAAHAGAALGSKLGPLPVWVWGVAIAGGLGIAYLARSRASSSSSAAMDGTPVDDTPATVGNLGAVASSVAAAVSGTGSYSTNQDWQTAAENRLISLGFTPTYADGALRAYLSGTTLDHGQSAAIDAAIIAVGPAPSTPPPPPMPDSGLVAAPPAVATTTPTQDATTGPISPSPHTTSFGDNVLANWTNGAGEVTSATLVKYSVGGKSDSLLIGPSDIKTLAMGNNLDGFDAATSNAIRQQLSAVGKL